MVSLPVGSLPVAGFLLAISSCFLVFGPSSAQFLPPPPPCTPATAPPPELRPLDNDGGMSVDLIPGCSLSDDPVQKSAISETTAQRLALCNSFCINRALSGDVALNDAQKQNFSGYPVWLLATLSYLLSEDGVSGRDCIDGDGCSTNCGRFTPPFNPLNPSFAGGFVLALDCKLGCMLEFESTSNSSTCAADCSTNCNSIACQCNGLFGTGCFTDQAPPCGRDCNAGSCGRGCTDANSHMTNTPTYPSSANPTQAPVVTQIGNGTRYMINITNSIPSGVSGDLGYSTLIVRVHDLSSTTQDDFTYYVLENGFEFDLAPFECRRVNISFAVATVQSAVSSYSPVTTLELSIAGQSFPDQLTDFNFTVEQDNRAGFYQHHIIHLEWELPQDVEFATGYTISLSPVSNPVVCSSAAFDITNGSLTSYTIRSGNSTQPPVSNCVYIIQIAVNPRDRGSVIAQETIGPLSYNDPSINNIASSCSVVLDRSTVAYDITFHLRLDETFTPAVISAIDFLRVGSFQVNSNGDAIVAPVTIRNVRLGSNVTQGPITLSIPFDNFPQLENGRGYDLSIQIQWIRSLPRSPNAIFLSCQTYDVQPIAPDPVEDLTVTFMQALTQSNTPSSSGSFEQILITLRYTWTAPEFEGEGITGYQAWLDRGPAPDNPTGSLQQIGLTTSDMLSKSFEESDTNFTLYFQIRPVSANTQGNWSQPIVLNVHEIPPTALNVNVTCSSVLNMTTRSYDISVVFFIDATFTLSRVSAIDSIRTTVVEVDGSGSAVLPNFRRESVTFQGIERGPGNVTLVFPNNRPLADRQGFYSVQSFLVWNSSFPTLPSTVGGSCQVLDVGPLPPDPITNLQLLSTRKRFSIDRKSVRVAANISWTAPEFIGTEGSITGYQVWFNAVPASSNVTRFVTHGALARSAGVEMVFDVGDTDFSLFLQIRALSANTIGNWSQSDILSLQIRVPCPVGFFRDPSVISFQCIPCPANTNVTLLNDATICPCLPGYFRAPGDNPGVACSLPPTACRNLRLNLLGDRRLDIMWEKPSFTGRGDLYYILEWSVSLSPSVLTSLGFSDREINGSATIFDRSDTVSHSITGLRPDTPYSVSVTARNAVSNQGAPGSEDSSRCQLQGGTLNATNGSLSFPSTTGTSRLTTLLGCGIELVCGGTGSEIIWRFFGTRIDVTNTTNRTITTETNSTSNTVHSRLMIDPTMSEDTDVYTCVIIDPDSRTTISYAFSLTVENTFVNIEPIEDIELFSDQLGQVITINCRVSTCRDNAEVVLARDFEVLNRGELFSDATRVVLITDLVASDNITGNYVCRVSQGGMIHQTSFRITKRVTCPRGTYKNSTLPPFECLPCPANTNRSMINVTVCPCLPGYFRTSSEGPEIGCTRPPSACRNMKLISIGAHSVNVEWERPDFTGRDDFYYVLQYTDGESVGSNQVINQSQVVSQLITGLKPVTDYTITVTVVNGVSDQDMENEFRRRCALAVTTPEGVSSAPVDLQSFGDVVVWNEPLNPNGQIIEYEIQFFIPDTQLRITRSRNSQGTFYAVQDEDRLGENAHFRVRARTSAGAGQWSIELPLSSAAEATPTPPTTCPVCTCPVCPSTAPPCTCPTETPTSPPQPQGVHFVLRGQPLANNSVIALTDVGELGGALLCRTNLTSCCGTVPNRFGQFYYPSGVTVPINSRRQGFYRNRGNQEIRLHRRAGVDSPTGKFRCEIPDSNMNPQNLFITLI